METIIKQTREVGTSAGVLLPRSWLNKKVVVTLEEKTDEIIIQEVIEILLKQKLLNEVKGIYLIGSYARGDYDSHSDVDILIITKNISKIINHLDYEIVLISEKNFSKNLQSNLYRLISLQEAKTLLNDELILKYKNIKPKLNIREFIKDIERVLRINKGLLDDLKKQEKVPDATIYSIVLRLREIYYINCLLKRKNSSKKDFLKYVGENAYRAYSRIKNNEKEINDLSIEESLKLINLSKKWLKELKD
jgi:predicted nucleotidyltransferase